MGRFAIRVFVFVICCSSIRAASFFEDVTCNKCRKGKDVNGTKLPSGVAMCSDWIGTPECREVDCQNPLADSSTCLLPPTKVTLTNPLGYTEEERRQQGEELKQHEL